MAKVTNPLFSTEARGRVGGLVYNTWRGLATVKGKVAPAQPRTARQLVTRGYLTTLARAWSGLAANKRAAWNDWAEAHTTSDWTGKKVRSTGLNAYLALGSRMLDQSKTVPDATPSAAAPASPVAFDATGGSNQISCAFTPYGGTATQIELWLYGPHSAGRTPSITRASYKQRGPGETSPIVITGLVPGLYTVFARGLSETDGQVSGWVSDTVTVSGT